MLLPVERLERLCFHPALWRSLGGAMANLAAFDAARSVAHGALPRGCELRCYTFGAPRTGAQGCAALAVAC